MEPKVSFIVPCYKLAHLLADCINSILSQTYSNFEILIMDDCSPDQTSDVARSFRDPRLKYVRNDVNLGHLCNYNKGIKLARGAYVWLISADDRLRRPYVLDKYVQLMDNHPKVGYVFCPAVALQDGQEAGVMTYTSPVSEDTIFKGCHFLRKLLYSNCIAAPSTMVRRECYDEVSLFPLDMPHVGDWYLWCVFALHYDVAFIAEPMVHYRFHSLNMSKAFREHAPNIINENFLTARWRIKEMAEVAGAGRVVGRCKDIISANYAFLMDKKLHDNAMFGITVEEFEQVLLRHTKSRNEQSEIRGRVYAALGDQHYLRRDFLNALHCYASAVQQDRWMISTWVKYVLLRTGNVGIHLREGISTLRHQLRGVESDQ